MKFGKLVAGVLIVGGALLSAGCPTAPKTEEGKQKLSSNVETTLKDLYAKDPGLKDFLAKADAYVIFPSVGKGGLLIGGAYGRGEVYEHGNFVGYADISQATIGAQIGGQEFTEIVAFETDEAFQDFKQHSFKFQAGATAVALKSGVAAQAKYANHVVAFIDPKAGLMLEAAIGGQSFTYKPL